MEKREKRYIPQGGKKACRDGKRHSQTHARNYSYFRTYIAMYYFTYVKLHNIMIASKYQRKRVLERVGEGMGNYREGGCWIGWERRWAIIGKEGAGEGGWVNREEGCW